MQVNHGAAVIEYIKNLHGMVLLESEEWAGRNAVLDLFSGLVYSPHRAHPMADKLAVHSSVGGVTAAQTNSIFEMLAWRQAQFMVSSGHCVDAAQYVKDLERGLYDRAKVSLL